MKFRINTEVLLKAVKPATVIATKNVKRCGDNKEKFPFATYMSLEASPSSLLLKAYGGTSSITVKIPKSDGYIPIDSGCVTLIALELQSTLQSFPLGKDLLVSLVDDQLRITPESQEQNHVSIPIAKNVIRCPKMPKTKGHATVVDRKYFVKGLDRIKFAPAFEEKMHSYMCVLFESAKNIMSFSSGTGGRFAIINYECKGISTDETRLIIPSINILNIISVFKHSDQQTIKVRSVEAEAIHEIDNQIVLETDRITLAIYGLEHFSSYPDLTKITNYKHPYQIPTSIEAWKYIAGAIAASKHNVKRNIHNSRITADFLHGFFDVHTNTAMKMNRRVDFEFGDFVTDSSKDKNYKPWVCCNANYIREMVSFAGKDDIVVVNFEDNTRYEKMSERQVQEEMKPIVIKYPEKITKDGVKEESCMFFSASTKW